ncbi:MAG: metallophosphoesterase [Ruminococcus sp.]|nr:metallophosphoesterase [Ruminococcus sp.]
MKFQKLTLRQGFRRLLFYGLVAVILIPVCVFSNTHLTVTEYDFAHADIPEGFEGYRIVHLSDLHNAVFGENDEKLIGKITELAPDLIVLTGDMIDASNHTDYDKALLLMKQLPDIAPTYYVFGNHELELPKDKTAEFVAMAEVCGVHYLNDEQTVLQAENGDEITLIGLNDRSLDTLTLHHMVEWEYRRKFHLVLAHEPQLLSHYAKADVDLILSGHAHGGQFRLPFVGGLYAPDQGLFPKMTEGLHEKNGTAMIISRGLGNSAFPVRLGNFPEIVCITLHTQA